MGGRDRRAGVEKILPGKIIRDQVLSRAPNVTCSEMTAPAFAKASAGRPRGEEGSR